MLNAPDAMTVGDKRRVLANIGLSVPIETLRKQFESQQQKHERKIRISAELAATLTGPGYKIELVTPERQSIAEGFFFRTVWK